MPESRYPHWTGQIHNYSAEQVLSTMEEKMYSFAERAGEKMSEQNREDEQRAMEMSGGQANDDPALNRSLSFSDSGCNSCHAANAFLIFRYFIGLNIYQYLCKYIKKF